MTGTSYKDRRTGLIIFGVLSIVLGALLACFALATLLVMWVAWPVQEQGVELPSTGAVASSAMAYALMAVALIWTGIGSIRVQRWVRPIVLTNAWIWLLTGIITLGLWLYVAADLLEAAAAPDPGLVGMLVALGAGLIGAVFVFLPGLFVLFYRSQHVKATLDRYDPVERWTDRCPMTVLGLSLSLVYGAAACVLALPYRVFPAFGATFTGTPAAALWIAGAAVFVWLAWLVHRRSPAGWWATLAFLVLIHAAAILFLAGGPSQARRDESLTRGMADSIVLPRGVCLLLTAVLGAGSLIYMLSIRRLFRRVVPRSQPPRPAESS